LKKLPAGVLADTHIAMANIALEKGDMKAFNDQMNLVYQDRKRFRWEFPQPHRFEAIRQICGVPRHIQL